ncbi:MAG TPA: HdeD family acid-resistance protein [Streptosporangiaceae bacterium]|nr:HdeD family acid-resistance protein [Streptosporangiaceae bacterium]
MAYRPSQATARPNTPDGPYTGMVQRFGGSWQTTLGVGLITLVLGIIIVAWPGVTVTVVAVLFGIQLLLFGAFNIVRSIASGDASGGTRVLFALLGVLSIAVGALALRDLFQTIEVIAILFGLTWLIGGIIEFVSLVAGPSRPGRGWSILLALLTVIAGIIVLSYPTPSLVTLAVIFGVWLIVWGTMMAFLAVTGRSAERRARRHIPAHP